MSSVAASSSEYYEYNTSAVTTDDDDNENDDDDDGDDDDDDDDEMFESTATGMSSGCRRSQSGGTANAVTAKVASELYYHPQYHDHPHCPLPYL
mmetsp:Transcript_13164/g.14626  ORF Transcript_13164/g.14626 Transcript_13164/m.14626 type:complete len:94 (-) Transcript_13164:275-556(-)